MKKFGFACIGAVAVALSLAGCASTQREARTGRSGGAVGAVPIALAPLTAERASGDPGDTGNDPCAQCPDTWMATLKERTSSAGEVYKEAVWSTPAECDGDGGCTLVRKTRIRFYRDVEGRTPTGRPVPGTLKATMELWVKVPSARTLEQSFRVYDPRGEGRFALGPDTWDLPHTGTHKCVWNYATYPDDEYELIDSVCRWPSTCRH